MGFISNLFKKKEVSSLVDYNALHIDMHSHLIPGIDDGSKNMNDSLLLIKGLQDLGFKKIITTPHIMWGGYNNTPDIILRGRDEVRKALKANSMEIPFEAAAEYYLDETFPEKVKNKSLLTMGDNYVLVELSYLIKSHSATSYFYTMRNAGYKVILAHPERYPYYYEDDLEQYQEIKGQGVFFQLNIASLSGVYGGGAKRMAEKMIDANMIDFISTDLHNTRHLGYINDALKFPYLEKIMNYEGLMNKVLI